MRQLLEVVRLTADIPAEGLRRGDVGTIVEVLEVPELAYEVEFADAQGRTTVVTTLRPDQVRPVG